MTDLSFDAGDITAAIQKNMEGFDPAIESGNVGKILEICLLYTSPSPRDQRGSRMPGWG